jgi:hypothetical protein
MKTPQELEQRTMAQVSRRLLPLLFLLYLFCYLDRINVGMAALQMNGALTLQRSDSEPAFSSWVMRYSKYRAT